MAKFVAVFLLALIAIFMLQATVSAKGGHGHGSGPGSLTSSRKFYILLLDSVFDLFD
ncbi:hypothetical protein Ccrd_012512 [Cynara cardunculus var. scolymus]|uniref:Transmembrane protein n=1 Tax=Cynara cardunculus var. scolymus TaxID=59895 RepID=A0A124SHC9_CYNCS|nr:hypothetical protein Ccrd_012512 [Cynara cardunculus var. scolymus]